MAKHFDKILIANRGEIAIRIIKTLKKLGIRSVAVYSEADANSLHVKMADEAYFIGNSPATDSYLCIEHILAAVRESGSQAVHPGYGFLAENHKFAAALKKENVELIGPSSEAIRLMGDKIEAKKIAESAGVSTIPGYLGVIKTPKEAIKIAKKIGFPVIIKAAAGGGGRGMRVVYEQDQVEDAFISASNEARNSFSDHRVFIEKYIENPRHIEIQLLADKYGNAICLGERECSIQRHHQKIIEEAPSPFLSEKTRKKMYDQVFRLAKKMGYYSAGTVEFIVDSKQNFYFMEMNTRLQVEHCVTELVYGVDLVEEMIKIALSQKLELSQKNLKPNGWAIESRICAEDPTRGFLPSSGRITSYREPPRSSQIRIDSGVNEGSIVSMFYDQMIAKLITHAPTRMETIEAMRKGLSEYMIGGIAHNISFLEAIMQNDRFVNGDISTKFIEKEYPDGFLGSELTSELTQVFLAIAIQVHMAEAIRTAKISSQDADQVRKVGTRWVVNIDGSEYLVIIKPVTEEFTKGFNIRFENNRISIRTNWNLSGNLIKARINGKEVNVKYKPANYGYELNYAGRNVSASVTSPRVAELSQFMIKHKKDNFSSELLSPLAGTVRKIFVQEGEKVKLGQKLIVMEAMKMENTIVAEADCLIKAIKIRESDQVTASEMLIELEKL